MSVFYTRRRVLNRVQRTQSIQVELSRPFHYLEVS
jgi:hypothetical protein